MKIKFYFFCDMMSLIRDDKGNGCLEKLRLMFSFNFILK